MNILKFMDSFPPEFFGAPSWDRWRSVLAALYGLPPADPEFVRKISGGRPLPTEPARQSVWLCGRGAGKSRIVSLLAAYAATRQWRRVPGELVWIQVLAPSKKQSNLVHRYILGLLQSQPVYAGMIQREAEGLLELSNGVGIEVVSADFKTVRGRSVALAVVDEACHLPTDESATPDLELVRSLRPALGRVPGSMLLLVSTPWARRGVCFEEWQRSFGKPSSTLVIQAGTLDLNPLFDKATIEQEILEDPANAASEYGGLNGEPVTWRSDLESLLTLEALTDITQLGVYERAPRPDVTYRCFIDAAGGSGADSFALAIGHTERGPEGEPIEILDCVREWRPPFSPAAVMDDAASIIKRYRVFQAVSDHWGSEFVVEGFKSRGVMLEQCAKPSTDVYREVLPRINSGQVLLFEHARLRQQLLALERRMARTGRESISHPPGGHDDIAVAVCGMITSPTWAAPRARIRGFN